MSSCCGDDQQARPEQKKVLEVEPKNPIKRFFWKIGQEDAKKAQKNQTDKKSCCG